MDNRWFYFKKIDTDGNGTRYRALLVARGLHQRKGIDYNELFAPVARYATLRILLAMMIGLNLELLQCDLRAAFVNGELKEIFHMSQHECFLQREKEEYVYLLQKALYGLKQASRAWRKK